MGLSADLISQFAKITNDQKTSKIDEVTLYGEVVEFEDRICVKFDGSSEITPVTTISDVDEDGNATNYRYGSASVSAGDRVSVRLKNHSATITGNLSDPSMGKAEFVVAEDYILAKVDQVSLKVTGLGVEFEGLADGTTVIDGGCIKTGTIDAQRISLKGLLVYEYSVDGVNDWHYPVASGDVYRRESIDGGETWGEPYQFVGKDGQNGKDGSDGSDARVPSYVELKGLDFTDISSSYIKSPSIYGGEFYGTEFNVISDGVSGSFNLYGDYGGKQYHMFRVSYYAGDGAYVYLDSPASAHIYMNSTTTFGGNVTFSGKVYFDQATVSGLTATFA